MEGRGLNTGLRWLTCVTQIETSRPRPFTLRVRTGYYLLRSAKPAWRTMLCAAARPVHPPLELSLAWPPYNRCVAHRAHMPSRAR